ncbi:hypothetical protein LTSESEN_1861, partial [Salmonella enterica subsp. enterica serovar Senftenberg str. A4-543]
MRYWRGRAIHLHFRAGRGGSNHQRRQCWTRGAIVAG